MFIFRSIDCENETQYGSTEDATKKKKKKDIEILYITNKRNISCDTMYYCKCTLYNTI